LLRRYSTLAVVLVLSTACTYGSVNVSRIVLPTTGQLMAPSHNLVWMDVGWELFRSTDRGATWKQRPMLTDGQNELAFTSDRIGWVLINQPPEDSCSAERASIWRTSDAGSTWDNLGAKGVSDAQCKRALSCVDGAHCFLGTWDDDHAPRIYRTANGGSTWAASPPLPYPPGSTSNSLVPGRVHAYGATLLVEASGNQSDSTFVFRSTDGGATWGFGANVPAGSRWGGFFGFVSAHRWLLLVAPGQSRETLDGGASWHAYPSDYRRPAEVVPDRPEVVFADQQVGYVIAGGSRIQRTIDGGLHWTSIHTPGTVG
jgi:photosystem II stability/assembly factor-like uncharacterized protein